MPASLPTWVTGPVPPLIVASPLPGSNVTSPVVALKFAPLVSVLLLAPPSRVFVPLPPSIRSFWWLEGAGEFTQAAGVGDPLQQPIVTLPLSPCSLAQPPLSSHFDCVGPMIVELPPPPSISPEIELPFS